ncbi:MAG: hypothetical protein IPL65_09745 [Lewinellaceae bacterium]|nr:hypothetical protein [Lewinellaceae bacterium]
MKEFQEWIRANQWILILPILLIVGYYLLKWKIEEKRNRKAVIKERRYWQQVR